MFISQAIVIRSVPFRMNRDGQDEQDIFKAALPSHLRSRRIRMELCSHGSFRPQQACATDRFSLSAAISA
jgi:hypothetical protein